jgi:signal peptide peptidase SppA
MTHCVEIASRVFGTPLFMHPQKAEIVAWALRDRIAPGVSIAEPDANGLDANAFVGSRSRPNGRRALARAREGVAIIPVLGSLVNRGAWIDARSGVTSYEGVAAQIRDAATDTAISSILLDIDSPGGEATGMFGLAATIREVRKKKRIVAVVNDMAASAAYGIASAADEIVISPTSIVGSIGVIMIHLDRSGELAASGIKPTLIYAGDHKVDGNPFGPLSKEVAADIQRDVMTFYDRFTETVAAGRGSRLSTSAARETKARTFIGTDAIKVGLADRVASFDHVLAELTGREPASSTVATGSPQRTSAALETHRAAMALLDHQKGAAKVAATKQSWARAVARANGDQGL